MEFQRITIDPDRMGGAPTVRGMRLPVRTVVGMVTEEMSEREILEAYPDLTREDIRECLEFVREYPHLVTGHEILARPCALAPDGGGTAESGT